MQVDATRTGSTGNNNSNGPKKDRASYMKHMQGKCYGCGSTVGQHTKKDRGHRTRRMQPLWQSWTQIYGLLCQVCWEARQVSPLRFSKGYHRWNSLNPVYIITTSGHSSRLIILKTIAGQR
jgi:hypothetical protein